MDIDEKTPDRVSAVIGTFAKLIEKPDGYTSKEYPVVVGKKYKILDEVGCCYMVKIKGRANAIINKERFSLVNCRQRGG